MAANLTKGGFEVIGFDIDADSCSRLAELGGQVAASASDVVGNAEFNIFSLPLHSEPTRPNWLVPRARRDLLDMPDLLRSWSFQ